MGMDVHGENPKQNKALEHFPVLHKYTQMEKKDGNDGIDGFKQKWEELDADHDLREQYWKEQNEYDEINKGHYFRNNCWWWRPLWDFCYNFTDGIISEELWNSGHSNCGAGLDEAGAIELGNALMKLLKEGVVDKHEQAYKETMEARQGKAKLEAETNGKKFSDIGDWSYPFEADNVEEFAEFCLESGGFKIC